MNVSSLRYRRIVKNLSVVTALATLLVALVFLVAFKQMANPLLGATIAPANVGQADETSILLTMTVGTAEHASTMEEGCSETSSIIVPRSQPIVYCYLVTNLSDITFITHSVNSTLPAHSFDDLYYPLTISDTAAVTFTSIAATNQQIQSTWTAVSEQGDSISAANSVSVEVLEPSLLITYTVGLDPNSCSPTSSIVAQPNGSVAHCLQLANTGLVTFTQHTIVMQALNINATIPYTLAPGAILTIIETNRAELGITQSFIQKNIEENKSYAANVTSQTELADFDQGSATVLVDILKKDFSIDLRLSDVANGCPTVSFAPLENSSYFACVVLRNSSNVTFTDHTITLRPENLSVNFSYPLGPSQELLVTNETLTQSYGQAAILGPYIYTGNLDRGVTVTSTHPLGYIAIANSQLTVAKATPTPTFTPTITPTPTPKTPVPNTATWTRTPAPTGTPLPTPTETQTIAPTETPITPEPTPTFSYALSILTTPTPPADPFATQTQVAIEQTAQAAQFQQQPLDPVYVQQTEQAIFATQTYEALLASGQIPPTLDPNAQYTPPVDPNQQPLDPNAQPAPFAEPVNEQPQPESVLAEQPVATVTVELAPTETATETLTPEPTIRPIVPPTPAPSLDSFALFATVAGRMVTVASWVWLLLGTLFFLIAAISIAGFAFRTLSFSRDDEHFDLIDTDDPEQEQLIRKFPPATRPTSENWPESLP